MTGRSHFDFDDSTFLSDFENCTFPPELFTHQAHLRLAWILLQTHDPVKAGERLCALINRFDRHFGDGTKYHCTVTIAAAHIVNHFIRDKEESFQELIDSNPRLMTHFKEMVMAHYSEDIFRDKDAAKIYLAPLQPFL
jgi:hypothetical protein